MTPTLAKQIANELTNVQVKDKIELKHQTRVIPPSAFNGPVSWPQQKPAPASREKKMGKKQLKCVKKMQFFS